MRIDAGQHMRMEQRMKLSPRMIQSMEILQLPALALEERIEQELEQNPLLELAEQHAEPDETANGETEGEDERPLVVGDTESDNAAQDFQRAEDLAERYGDSWAQNTLESADHHPGRSGGGDDGEADPKMEAMANAPSRAPSLTDQLLDQWRFVEAEDSVRRAGEHLIAFLEDDGYLRTELQEIARQAPPGVTEAQLRQAWELVRQQLEPAGIGAMDLADCLLLQIDALTRQEGASEDLETARLLVRNHLHDLELNRLPRIEKRSGLSMDQIRAGLARLRRLDPRPGRRLAPESPEPIIPDVIVEYDPVSDRYVAGLAQGGQPDLRISPSYEQMTQDRSLPRQTRQYLSRNLSEARWLIDALQQRQSTLLRVVNVVIEAQREFLDHGPEHLKPLPMVQVAEQLGIHVGTVSRAVAEKYVQTPRGVFPLRMFFSGGTESDSGQEMRWSAIQAQLKQIIDSEDPKKPYSDDKLVEKLKEEGIDIARRTVAKYRQQLGVPPARQRKQY
jgi:RNA polymerase sigma-54 factor